MTPSLSPSAGGYPSHIVEGWIASLVLHGTAVFLGVMLMATVRLAPQPEPFQWDVSVVQSQIAVPAAPSTPLPTTPAPSAKPAIPAPAPIVAERPVQEMTAIQPTMTSAPLMQQPVPATEPAQNPVITQTRQAVVSSPPVPSVAEAPSRPKVVEGVIAKPVEPVSSPSIVEPPAKQPHQHNSQVVQMDATPVVESPRPETLAPVPPTPPMPRAEPSTENAPLQLAAVPSPETPSAPLLKPDRGWLSELLFKRVEQLKRYPSLARADRLEGKVIVKAMLHENGQLSDVEVLKSSGHDILDHAAVAVLQEASPLQLPRPLGKPAVPIKVPISYGLIDSLNSAK